MGKTGVMGSFEEMVLLAVLRRGPDAYAVEIRRELSDRTGTDVVMGAVYATLDRLQEKRFVRSRVEQREGAVGRPRRYYVVEAVGLEALNKTREIRDSMWDGLTITPARRSNS